MIPLFHVALKAMLDAGISWEDAIAIIRAAQHIGASTNADVAKAVGECTVAKWAAWRREGQA